MASIVLCESISPINRIIKFLMIKYSIHKLIPMLTQIDLDIYIYIFSNKIFQVLLNSSIWRHYVIDPRIVYQVGIIWSNYISFHIFWPSNDFCRLYYLSIFGQSHVCVINASRSDISSASGIPCSFPEESSQYTKKYLFRVHSLAWMVNLHTDPDLHDFIIFWPNCQTGLSNHRIFPWLCYQSIYISQFY